MCKGYWTKDGAAVRSCQTGDGKRRFVDVVRGTCRGLVWQRRRLETGWGGGWRCVVSGPKGSNQNKTKKNIKILNEEEKWFIIQRWEYGINLKMTFVVWALSLSEETYCRFAFSVLYFCHFLGSGWSRASRLMLCLCLHHTSSLKSRMLFVNYTSCRQPEVTPPSENQYIMLCSPTDRKAALSHTDSRQQKHCWLKSDFHSSFLW